MGRSPAASPLFIALSSIYVNPVISSYDLPVQADERRFFTCLNKFIFVLLSTKMVSSKIGIHRLITEIYYLCRRRAGRSLQVIVRTLTRAFNDGIYLIYDKRSLVLRQLK